MAWRLATAAHPRLHHCGLSPNDDIADLRKIVEAIAMRGSIITAVCLSVALSGCSYSYDLIAIARGGQVVFIVADSSKRHPDCLREIEVMAEGQERARPAPGDDASRVGYGTFWSESVSYDDGCTNKFPLTYGSPLKGGHLQDRGMVQAKPLLREVVYEVSG